jgi:hypothetical protein
MAAFLADDSPVWAAARHLERALRRLGGGPSPSLDQFLDDEGDAPAPLIILLRGRGPDGDGRPGSVFRRGARRSLSAG